MSLMNVITSSTAKGSTIPASASRVRDSLPGSLTCLSNANTAAPSVAARIDPISSPCSNEKSNSQTAASPVIAGGNERTDRCEADCRTQHRADLCEPGGQPGLEQDRGGSDHPDSPGELVVLEVNPVGAVRADRHAQPEKEDKRRQAETIGNQRGCPAGEYRVGGRRVDCRCAVVVADFGCGDQGSSS